MGTGYHVMKRIETADPILGHLYLHVFFGAPKRKTMNGWLQVGVQISAILYLQRSVKTLYRGNVIWTGCFGIYRIIMEYIYYIFIQDYVSH